MQLQPTADVYLHEMTLTRVDNSGLAALHTLCQLGARLEAADAQTRPILLAHIAPQLDRLMKALVDGPASPGFHGGHEPLALSALTILEIDGIPATSRFVETMVRSLADPSVAISLGDLGTLERQVAQTERGRLFAKVIRERKAQLKAQRTPRSVEPRRSAEAQR